MLPRDQILNDIVSAAADDLAHIQNLITWAELQGDIRCAPGTFGQVFIFSRENLAIFINELMLASKS